MSYYFIDEPFLFFICAEVVEQICFMTGKQVIIVHDMLSDKTGMEGG